MTTYGQVGSYSTHQRGAETPRETDAQALLRCANRLDLARRPETTREAYIEALQINQRLWTIFQVCLTEPDNPLPSEVKINLFQLSRFVDKMSFRAMGAKCDIQALDELVNINRQIAAGLSAMPRAFTEPGAQPPPAPPTGPITTTA